MLVICAAQQPFNAGTNVGTAADYVPNLTITPHASISCRLPGRMVLNFEVVVISIKDGFDQIQRFEFESISTSVVCGTYTSPTPPPDGHFCILCVERCRSLLPARCVRPFLAAVYLLLLLVVLPLLVLLPPPLLLLLSWSPPPARAHAYMPARDTVDIQHITP